MTREKIVTVPRPQSELHELLAEQLDALETLCAAYDQGKKHFASEIALNLRVLLFDNPSNGNRSLLHQLNMEVMDFCDTARTMKKDDPNTLVIPASGLAFTTVIPEATGYRENWEPNIWPLREQKLLATPFKAWWERPIMQANSGEKFSRKRIIRNVANQDRGGHVAPGLEKAYFQLTRQADHGYQSQIIEGDAVTNPDQQISPERVSAVSQEGAGVRFVRALVRQIAHETLLTLLSDAGAYIASIPKPNQGIMPVVFLELAFAEPPFKDAN